jgi:hypothetical protein
MSTAADAHISLPSEAARQETRQRPLACRRPASATGEIYPEVGETSDSPPGIWPSAPALRRQSGTGDV